ncbi:hypothetical protein HYPSUDRAFT_43620 [Hypholoma sublateritium FD-334 SS-4]|uniref:Secreted protein n=1 Tax=Hypholoma sublateritium (strain FD-334 SS-4) TaxID=945553 RepID=A0A0D2M9L1_HYPSF|nr:hypothetical protein HYPSUDRAFT_43620 [Hypholoma sublateritium FD-334 SS-4]
MAMLPIIGFPLLWKLSACFHPANQSYPRIVILQAICSSFLGLHGSQSRYFRIYQPFSSKLIPKLFLRADIVPSVVEKLTHMSIECTFCKFQVETMRQ